MSEVTICLSFVDQIVNQRTFYSIYHKGTFLSKHFPWYGVTHGLLPTVANYNHLLTITSIFLKNGQKKMGQQWSTEEPTKKNRTSTNFVILKSL